MLTDEPILMPEAQVDASDPKHPRLMGIRMVWYPPYKAPQDAVCECRLCIEKRKGR